MSEKLKASINKILHISEIKHSKRKRGVLQSILNHAVISRHTHEKFCDDPTFGERTAGKVAIFDRGRSIILFAVV